MSDQLYGTSAKSSRTILSDFSLEALAAGFLAVFVSYSGPLLIYVTAAKAMGASTDAFASWVFAISVAGGLTSIGLSLWYRVPMAIFWSAPGTALLVSIGTSLPFSDVVGAYITVAALLFTVGITGLYDRLASAIPQIVANGMMAGILFGFGVRAMSTAGEAPVMFAILMASFVVLSVWTPRFSLILLLGIALLLMQPLYGAFIPPVSLAVVQPIVTWPTFSLAATFSLAVPLFITTLAGQFLPGMMILKANGFTNVEARPLIVVASIASIAAALFGGITTALASITAALTAGPEAHVNAARRYWAGVVSGAVVCLAGVFAGSIVALLNALPTPMITMLAGIALLGAIGKSISLTTGGPEDAQAGVITFMIAASNFSLLGVGSAFWGVLVGVLVVHLSRIVRRVQAI